MSWLGLTLELNAAEIEAFSDALMQAGAQSVWLDNLDAPRLRLQALLAGGSRPQEAVAAASIAAGLPEPPRFSVQPIENEDWIRKSQAQFAPVEIGERLWVGPSWHKAPSGRVVVQLDPGLAFGTGTHPTTRLVLAFLEKLIVGGESLLDYGCGSGILAIAAAKLGAARVDGVDTDPRAVETAAANARANAVTLRAALPEALPSSTYDIVVSNILAQPLIMLAPILATRLVTGGRLALSGILETQAAELAATYAVWFDTRVTAVEDGWALFEGVRK